MEKMSYEALVHELSYGRELEFEYGGGKFAVSLISSEERYFTVYAHQVSVRFSSLELLLSQVTIGGKELKDIWPEVSEWVLF